MRVSAICINLKVTLPSYLLLVLLVIEVLKSAAELLPLNPLFTQGRFAKQGGVCVFSQALNRISEACWCSVCCSKAPWQELLRKRKAEFPS